MEKRGSEAKMVTISGVRRRHREAREPVESVLSADEIRRVEQAVYPRRVAKQEAAQRRVAKQEAVQE